MRKISTASAVIVAAVMIYQPAAAEYRGHVYDADTLGPTARLTIDGALSFDAPETSYRFGAECDLEIERGKAARVRTRALLDDPTAKFRPLLEADGSIARDDIGRLLMRVEIGGENIGHILAREGHAMLYNWRTDKPQWCATPPVLQRRVK